MGELYTDNTNDADANDDDANDTRWTNHDCIGSLPNAPKTLTVYCGIGEYNVGVSRGTEFASFLFQFLSIFCI